jgi:hypothetical protein
MVGKFNKAKSWEQQHVYDLDNGAWVTVGYCHYGPIVQRIDDAEGHWHHSNGYETIPERFAFALGWLKPLGLPRIPEAMIMRPGFKMESDD